MLGRTDGRMDGWMCGRIGEGGLSAMHDLGILEESMARRGTQIMGPGGLNLSTLSIE